MMLNLKFGKYLLCISVSYFFSLFILCNSALSYDFEDWDRGAMGYEISVVYAKDNDKPVLVYFHKGEEELSEKVNDDYFSDDDVEAFIGDLPKAEINPDSGEDEKAISEEYNVEQCPAIFVLMPISNGKPQEIKPFGEENMTAEDFLNSIQGAVIYLYNETALEYFENKDYSNAIKYLDLALEYDPDRAYSYYAMGIIYHTLGIQDKDPKQIKLAEDNYLRALDIDPEHENAKEQLKTLREDKLKMGMK